MAVSPITASLAEYGMTSTIKGNVQTATYTGTATTGQFVSGKAYINEHTGQLEIEIKSPSSAVPAGGNVFIGNLSGNYLPKYTTRLVNFYGSLLLIGALTPSGSFSVRAIGSGSGSFPANTNTTLYGTALF